MAKSTKRTSVRNAAHGKVTHRKPVNETNKAARLLDEANRAAKLFGAKPDATNIEKAEALIKAMKLGGLPKRDIAKAERMLADAVQAASSKRTALAKAARTVKAAAPAMKLSPKQLRETLDKARHFYAMRRGDNGKVESHGTSTLGLAVVRADQWRASEPKRPVEVFALTDDNKRVDVPAAMQADVRAELEQAAEARIAANKQAAAKSQRAARGKLTAGKAVEIAKAAKSGKLGANVKRAVDKLHPADKADRDAIKSAVMFTAHLPLGRGNKVHEEFKTLARAVLRAEALRGEYKGRDVLVYAVTPDGRTVHVPKALQQQALAATQKLASSRNTKAEQRADAERAVAEHAKRRKAAKTVKAAKQAKPAAKPASKAAAKPARAARTRVSGTEWVNAWQPKLEATGLKKGSRGEALLKLLRTENGLTDAQLSDKAGVKHAISPACGAAARAGLQIQKRRNEDGSVVYRVKPNNKR